jgi:hypothetical protein
MEFIVGFTPVYHFMAGGIYRNLPDDGSPIPAIHATLIRTPNSMGSLWE